MGNGASRAAFRYVLLELQERDVAIEEADFWDQLWKAETSPYDVFEVISPSSVRKLRTERLGNVRGLICASLAELEKTAADPDVHMVPRAMTAIRILTRVLPFLLEDYVNPETGVISPDLHRLFWSTEEAPPKAEHAAETTGDAGEKGTDGKGKEGDEVLPLGAALVSVTMRLLFTRQLTVDMFSTFDANAAAEQRTKDADGEAQNVCPRVQDPSSIWCKGLSVSEPANIQYGRDLESHRVELMRLLLVLLCEPLFQSSTNFNPASSRFAEELCRVDTPFAAELFYSLLSVIVMYDPVGWGVPYAGAFTSDMPLRQLDKAAQLLVVLLDHGKPPLPVVTNPAPQDGAFEVDVHSAVREDPPAPGARDYNVFRNLVLHGLKEEEDFKLVYTGLARLLANLHLSQSAYIPSSGTAVKCYQEVLVLLWKIMEENPAFTQYVLKHCDVNEVLVSICFLLVENRKDVSKGGLIHICTFILLKISGERLFGVAINKPCTIRLPTELPLFTGSHLDLLILTLHKMLVAGSERLSTLYHCFLTVLCNVSPYCKSMSLVASVKLLNLFELFTSSRNLYASEVNQTYVSMLLEMFSNIIQYQYGGNAHLIYAIVRRREVFDNLGELDLPRAIAEAQDYARKTKDKTGSEVEQKGNGRGGEGDAPQPAVGVKAGPEDNGESFGLSEVVLQQSSGVSKGGSDAEDAVNGDSSDAVVMRFRPTQEWLDKMRSEVPFNTIMRLLQNLAPQVVEMCSTASALDEATMIEFVSNTTMVGLLPVPHPIVIRKYHPNEHTAIWFTAFMWGVVFVRNQELPIFDGQKIRLFTVSSSEQRES